MPRTTGAKKPKRSSIHKAAKTIAKRVKRVRRPKDRRKLLLLPSPSTLFNCACSDNPFGAFDVGHPVNIIGDSSSGKSIFALSMMAEIFYSPIMKKHNFRFIYDDAENANTFDMHYLFGEEFAEAVEAPEWDEELDEPLPSRTIEDFHCNVCDALEGDRPVIYVLDSFDSVDSEQDIKKTEEMRMARKKGNKMKGDYGMSKPKKASQLLRNICGRLKRTKSLLIIISQTRDNINPISFEKKTRAGGRALKFYCHHEIWLAMAGKLMSKKHPIGNSVKCKITKNKLTGKFRIIDFPIFYDYGVDDIRSCIDWLVAEKFWSKSGTSINAKEFGLKGQVGTLVRLIEEQQLEYKLRKLVGEKWTEVEESLRLNRKPKYREI
jgi:hypothetical protein